MNVVISNLNKNKFSNLNVDVIKSISGEFTAEEIVQSFSNFFFNRMFLDVTAIAGYTDIFNIKKLSVGLDVSKVILFLGDDSYVNSSSYISKLIDIGIYNFARTEDELIYLYNNPNLYKDVAHLQKVDNNLIVNNNVSVKSDTKIIGFKNFTNHAGSSSLIYMLKKILSRDYYVVCIEVNKSDFLFFRDNDMISVKSDNLVNTLSKYKNANVILIDLNDLSDSDSLSLCSDVVYLIEPSVIEINRIAILNNKSFSKLKDFKVVLNDCLLSEGDALEFGREAGVNIFYSIPPLNDRVDNSRILVPFLAELGLYKRVDDGGKSNFNKIFNF